jgi:anaerobic ribonucleoside-triphosphate reductase activating protein
MDIHGIFRNMAQNPLLRGVTFSGGEPFMQAKPLARLGEMAHGIHLDVVTYSGYTYEQILEGATPQNGWGDLLAQTDWLIDGPFLIGQKSLDLAFRGSRNQRIIDVAASAKEGRAVEIQGFSPRRRGRAPAGK